MLPWEKSRGSYGPVSRLELLWRPLGVISVLGLMLPLSDSLSARATAIKCTRCSAVGASRNPRHRGSSQPPSCPWLCLAVPCGPSRCARSILLSSDTETPRFLGLLGLRPEPQAKLPPGERSSEFQPRRFPTTKYSTHQFRALLPPRFKRITITHCHLQRVHIHRKLRPKSNVFQREHARQNT